MESVKTCRTCCAEKAPTDFYACKARRDGLFQECKDCSKLRSVAWRIANPERVKEHNRKGYYKDPQKSRERRAAWVAANPTSVTRSRRRRGLLKYGLTPEQYDQMVAAQGGGCAICRQPCKSGKALAVDHCHETGAVRGLLCTNCNTSIGKMNDSPEQLLRAVAYLEASRGT